MALYGHEISESINVLQAGLSRYAKLGMDPNSLGSNFVGREALLQIERSGGPKRKLVGLR